MTIGKSFKICCCIEQNVSLFKRNCECKYIHD